MKYWLLGIALICFATSANATPYFRLLDISHPQPVLGALIDPSAPGNTEAASLIPILTHSPKDGCLLPSVVCEEWTPLALGASMNAGKITLDVAPLANVLPWFQKAAIAVTPAKWQGLIGVLSPSQDKSVTFSAGPVWQYRQLTNKGYFRVFTGLALHF
jgi:hypothetical protein